MKSTVYLVGAGPGDSGLITVKGKELISKADAIVYDYLANNALIKETKKDCKIIYAGKGLGFKAMSQNQINKKLINLAKSGLETIVRLKGGDPFLFGRGGEEAEGRQDARRDTGQAQSRRGGRRRHERRGVG